MWTCLCTSCLPFATNDPRGATWACRSHPINGPSSILCLRLARAGHNGLVLGHAQHPAAQQQEKAQARGRGSWIEERSWLAVAAPPRQFGPPCCLRPRQAPRFPAQTLEVDAWPPTRARAPPRWRHASWQRAKGKDELKVRGRGSRDRQAPACVSRAPRARFASLLLHTGPQKRAGLLPHRHSL